LRQASPAVNVLAVARKGIHGHGWHPFSHVRVFVRHQPRLRPCPCDNPQDFPALPRRQADLSSHRRRICNRHSPLQQIITACTTSTSAAALSLLLIPPSPPQPLPTPPLDMPFRAGPVLAALSLLITACHAAYYCERGNCMLPQAELDDLFERASSNCCLSPPDDPWDTDGASCFDDYDCRGGRTCRSRKGTAIPSHTRGHSLQAALQR